MVEEDFDFEDEKQINKRNVGKKNATDRIGETNAEDLEEREDEADETVFIDNLPKDEKSLKEMINDVNMHIRELEK